MELHDLEAYLCLPELLSKISHYTAGHTDQVKYCDMIIEIAMKNKWKTIKKYSDKLFPIGESVSIKRENLDQINTENIADLYCDRRDEIMSRIREFYSDGHINRKIGYLVNHFDTAIESRNASEILRLFSGKLFFNALVPVAEIRNKIHQIKIIERHSLVETIVELNELRARIRSLVCENENT